MENHIRVQNRRSWCWRCSWSCASRSGSASAFRSRFANGLKRFVQRVYCPVLDPALRWRYLTASVGVGVMIVTVGLVPSGRPGFRFVPSLEIDVVSASMTLPQGTPVEATGEAVAKLEAGAGASPPAPARGDRPGPLRARAGGGRRPAPGRAGRRAHNAGRRQGVVEGRRGRDRARGAGAAQLQQQ